MNHECHTNHQGRAPCTCGGLHTDNSDGSDPHHAWTWIDDIAQAVRWFAIVIIGAFTVLLMAGFFSLN